MHIFLIHIELPLGKIVPSAYWKDTWTPEGLKTWGKSLEFIKIQKIFKVNWEAKSEKKEIPSKLVGRKAPRPRRFQCLVKG